MGDQIKKMYTWALDMAVARQKGTSPFWCPTGVSLSTWSLFAILNVGLYIYAQKYTSLQLMVGLLGTAALDALVVVLALTRERK